MTLMVKVSLGKDTEGEVVLFVFLSLIIILTYTFVHPLPKDMYDLQFSLWAPA